MKKIIRVYKEYFKLGRRLSKLQKVLNILLKESDYNTDNISERKKFLEATVIIYNHSNKLLQEMKGLIGDKQ